MPRMKVIQAFLPVFFSKKATNIDIISSVSSINISLARSLFLFQLWTPLNTILLNLILSDFSVSIIGNPFVLISALARGWIFGDTLCQLYGFFMSLLGISSIVTLSVLAFERYMIVSKPFENSITSTKGALFLILGIWTYSFLLTMPPLVGWGKYVHEAANISCSVNWECKSFNSMTYTCFLFFFGLVIPLLVIIFSYINIVLQMRQNSLKIGQVKKAERRVAYMVLLMIIAFVVAWMPYAVLALLIQFGDASFLTPGMRVIPSLIAKSSICYNPIIYVVLNSQFRQSWKQRKCVGSNNSESFAMCLSKYISQNIDSPVKNPRKINAHLKEFAKVNKRKELTLKVFCNDIQNDARNSSNEATDL
ncbi:hypothetical protein WA026_009674 [Henosepilachna vigintioctopunctata]|uniref:G-protein coupled receptors family 1 profile domain-containing protein n=1 Tax=Henosepilachna vigintioctopunctata TaxID=420089 RepID=A0AAW1U023_9CUCU